MKKEEIKKLENLAKPLVNFLEENSNPYTQIIIDNQNVRLVENVASIPIASIKKA